MGLGLLDIAAPPESIENVRLILQGNANSGIADGDPDRIFERIEAEPNRSAGRRIFPRVLQQNCNQPLQVEAIRQHHPRRIRQAGNKLKLRSLQQRLPFFADLPANQANVHRLQLHLFCAGVGARQE